MLHGRSLSLLSDMTTELIELSVFYSILPLIHKAQASRRKKRKLGARPSQISVSRSVLYMGSLMFLSVLQPRHESLSPFCPIWKRDVKLHIRDLCAKIGGKLSIQIKKAQKTN